MEIRIAHCCRACKHSSKPKKPEDHAAYYSVAKTERWCYKHGINITRETVCDEFEIENKKGAVPAFKRILAFNKKLEKIIEIKNWMQNSSIDVITYDRLDFAIVDDKIHYKYNNWKDMKSPWYLVSCKDSGGYNELLKAYEKHNQ